MYLTSIITQINRRIAEAFPNLNQIQLLNVCELVKRSKGGKDIVWPAMYVAGGDMQYAGVDDGYDLVVYHRLLSIASAAGKAGYGNQVADTKNTVKASMVVYGHKDKLKHSADTLALLLQSTIPDNLTGKDKPQGIDTLVITISDIVLNTEQAFNEEYKGTPFFLAPEHILLKVNYNIESTFDKRCFNTYQQ